MLGGFTLQGRKGCNSVSVSNREGKVNDADDALAFSCWRVVVLWFAVTRLGVSKAPYSHLSQEGELIDPRSRNEF